MYISKISITSYAGFEETGDIALSPRINIVSGRNNAGKSSLLKAISCNPSHNPHKDESRFLPGNLLSQKIEIDIVAKKSEFIARLAESGASVNALMDGPSDADTGYIKQQIDSTELLTFKARLSPGRSIINREPAFKVLNGGSPTWQAGISVSQGEIRVQSGSLGGEDSTVTALFQGESPPIFFFTAERYHRARTRLDRHTALLSDASNLAGYLQYLQGNHINLFREIISKLTQIIPSIEDITIDTHHDGFEVLVWPRGGLSNRNLVFSLSDCGSGVSQILAILAAVVSRNDAVIVVDEINSFLHPLAVKDLISILAADYPSHQYIISSHSSEVISHPSVSRVLDVERKDFKSSVRTFDREDLQSMKASLRSLGVSMMDVLGSDKFLWVEGPTEAIAIPNLIREHVGEIPYGLQIASVSSTGDFEAKGKDKRAVTRLYDHVTGLAAPLAGKNAFLLDRENLSDESVQQFQLKTDKKLSFLKRRCLENYVLDAELIAGVLNEESELGAHLEADEVRGVLIALAKDNSIRGSRLFNGDLNDIPWLKAVDGAKLLATVFYEVTSGKIEFRKVVHTPRMLSKASSGALEEMIEVVRERTHFLLS